MEGAVTEIAQATRVDTETPADLLSRPGARRVIIVVGLIAAIALRVFVAVGPVGALHTDEAVSGLMARHILDGEAPVFYWGQNYGGTAEIFVTAALFAVTDSSTAALRIVPLVFFVGAAFLIWQIGKRWFGEPGASIAAVLFLVWPAYFVWKSMQAHGYYGFLILLGVAALHLTLRIDETPTIGYYALLGVTLGLGWWTSLQVVLIGIPLLVWLLARANTRRLKGFAAMGAGAVVGSAPWLIWNYMHDWSSITEIPSSPDTTYTDRLVGLFTDVLPAGLGIKVPGGAWFFPGWTRWIVLVAILAAFGLFVFRSSRVKDARLMLLGGIALAFPWLYALSPHTWYLAEPRYLLLLFPVLCLMVGWGFNQSYTVRLFTTALALPISSLGLIGMNAQFATAPDLEPNPRATRLAAVIQVLGEHDQRYVITDYWMAYPISFETREEIIATSSGHVRYVPHDALVRSKPHPAYVFVTGEENQEAFERDRLALYEGYVPVLRDEYTVYIYRPVVTG